MSKLSLRLKAVASLVPCGARVCDIGTDHAYLAIELMKSGTVKSVIATDINEKPLENARKNIKKSNADSVELRLCDGLSGIFPEEVDTVIIAGMGGEVISGILERGKAVVQRSGTTLILQPTTSPETLRRFLCENGFDIKNEIPICENGKLYSVISAVYSGIRAQSDEAFFYSGKLDCTTPEGLMYIQKQRKRCFECMNALKKIPNRFKDYAHYKSAYEGLDNLIKEQTNGF